MYLYIGGFLYPSNSNCHTMYTLWHTRIDDTGQGWINKLGLAHDLILWREIGTQHVNAVLPYYTAANQRQTIQITLFCLSKIAAFPSPTLKQIDRRHVCISFISTRRFVNC